MWKLSVVITMHPHSYSQVGGSIGTGLFIGTGGALAKGGPLGVLIAWAVMGTSLPSRIIGLY